MKIAKIKGLIDKGFKMVRGKMISLEDRVVIKKSVRNRKGMTLKKQSLLMYFTLEPLKFWSY